MRISDWSSDVCSSDLPVGPKNAVGDAGFVLDGYKQHAPCRAGALTYENDAGELDVATIADRRKVRAAPDAPRTASNTKEHDRMPTQRQLDYSIILYNTATLHTRPQPTACVEDIRTPIA